MKMFKLFSFIIVLVVISSNVIVLGSEYQWMVLSWQNKQVGEKVGTVEMHGIAAASAPTVGQEDGKWCAKCSFQLWMEQKSYFEAEQAQISGANSYVDPNASGGCAVGGFGEHAGDSISFKNVPPASRLNFHYNNGSGASRQAGLYINGKKVKTLHFADTGGWYSPFQVVSYEGDISGTVSLVVEQEDWQRNQTFCCNIDGLSLGEPPKQLPSVQMRLPLDETETNRRVASVSCLVRPGKLPFEIGLELRGAGVFWSQPLIQHRSDPNWCRFTVLVSDLCPVHNALEESTIEAVRFRFKGHQGPSEFAVRNVLFVRGWPSTPPRDCPLERSEDFAGIAFTGRHKEYTRADTWYPSWASNGLLYSPYTDGYVSAVFVHSDNADATTGMAKIEGDDPLNLKVTDIGFYKSRPWPFATRYPCGSLVYNGLWYYGTYIINGNMLPAGEETMLGPFVGFRTSSDYGKTWTETPCTPLNNLFGEEVDKVEGGYTKVKIGSPHFVDFGKNMENSPDGKAYLVAHGSTDITSPQSWMLGDHIYLLRVVPGLNTINQRSSYEYFAGYNVKGRAIWSKNFSEMRSLFSWKLRCGCVTATYIALLEKYLMFVTTGSDRHTAFDTYVLESDNVAGPYKLVTYMQEFGRQAYFVNVPSKFVSKNGRKMWLCYAANYTGHSPSPRHSKYAMSLQEFQMVNRNRSRGINVDYGPNNDGKG